MTRKVEASITFSVPTKVLFGSFLDARDLSKMVLSPATIEPVVGGQFSLFNGGVTGTIIALVPESLIVQKWRFSQWAPEVFSNVQLRFISLGPQRTRLEIVHTEIPDKDAHGNLEQDTIVLSGWKEKFFLGIEKVLGFPVDRDL